MRIPSNTAYGATVLQDPRYPHFSIFALADGHNGRAAPTYFAAQAVQRIAALFMEKHVMLAGTKNIGV